MLFSATMPAAIVALARTPHAPPDEHPRRVVVRERRRCPATAQFIYQAHDLDKPEIIGRILQAEDADKIIVFTRTKRQAQRVADDLAERGFRASPLHGDMAQVAREKALTKFREDKIQVLVATDVAARGIDVAGRLPRHQLHLPRGRQDLRPPDRPHRPRRRLRHRDHLRRLGRPAPLEDDQQGARPAVRRAAGDLLDLRAPLPRPGHPAGHQGPDRRPEARASPASRARTARRPRVRGDRAERPQPQPQPDPHPQRRGGRRCRRAGLAPRSQAASTSGSPHAGAGARRSSAARAAVRRPLPPDSVHGPLVRRRAAPRPSCTSTSKARSSRSSIFELARRNGVALPYDGRRGAAQARYAFADLQSLPRHLLRGRARPADRGRLLRPRHAAYFAARHAPTTCVHAELFFDPQTHTAARRADGDR